MKTKTKMTRILMVVFLTLLMTAPACRKGEQTIDRTERHPEHPNERSIPQPIPEIVPYLDAVPSTADGKGHATVLPRGPFPAGSKQNFEMTFHVAKPGIAPGGFVLLQISPWWGWSQPQNQHPTHDGFMSVQLIPRKKTNLPKKIETQILSMHRVLVFSPDHHLEDGDTLIFKYQQARVDRYAEKEEFFRFFVDGDGDGHSACIANPPTLRITARKARFLAVSAPPQAKPGQTITISVAPLDSAANWSQFPKGTYTLTVQKDAAKKDDSQTVMVSENPGDIKNIVFNYVLPEEGIYLFQVRGPDGLQGKGNVTLCRAGTPTLNLYFGDIHGHSVCSDGTGTPDDYYKYARGVSGLDIAALTDHADYGMEKPDGNAWKRIKEATANHYKPGTFVTFTAFEWTSWTYGHRNVYYPGNDGPLFRAIDPHSDTPDKLWNLIAPHGAFTIAHHVGGGPVPTDWNAAPGPREMLVEICSVHGSSEYYGGEKCIYRPQKGHFVRDALAMGYRLGIMASGDTHDGHPGQGGRGAPAGGLMGVYAETLTRESIWKAMKKRRVYGTSGPKIILNFRVGDSPMGSELDWPASAGPLPIALRAVCPDHIKTIEILRNGTPILQEKGDGRFALFLVQDPAPPNGTSWYYARVIQQDGNLAWSSPVWVRYTND